MAALQVAQSGYYDEALNQVRSLGEMANLFALFAADRTSFAAWAAASKKVRLSQYGPAAVRTPGQKTAVGGLDATGLAGVGTALVDAAFEDPRMAPQQRTLLAGPKPDVFHGPDCPTRAQSSVYG